MYDVFHDNEFTSVFFSFIIYDLLTGHFQKCPVKKGYMLGGEGEGEGRVSMGFQCFIEFFRHNVINVLVDS